MQSNIIEFEVTREDVGRAARFIDNEDNLAATCLKRLGFQVVSSSPIDILIKKPEGGVRRYYGEMGAASLMAMSENEIRDYQRVKRRAPNFFYDFAVVGKTFRLVSSDK